MPTYNDRLRYQKKRLGEKEKQLERFTASLETAKENIKNVNREIADIKSEIANIETRLLAEMIAQKGISISELSAAIEAGVLADITEKPPDKSEKTDIEKSAIYGTTELPEKEGLDEISSSGETVGGS
ncbi:MAG: hypothetical protein K2O14_03140 [Oscillospiraceae bacterium]|nr:hypothetical protein [Oscillospiraceae bacterium]